MDQEEHPNGSPGRIEHSVHRIAVLSIKDCKRIAVLWSPGRLVQDRAMIYLELFQQIFQERFAVGKHALSQEEGSASILREHLYAETISLLSCLIVASDGTSPSALLSVPKSVRFAILVKGAMHCHAPKTGILREARNQNYRGAYQ